MSGQFYLYISPLNHKNEQSKHLLENQFKVLVDTIVYLVYRFLRLRYSFSRQS